MTDGRRGRPATGQVKWKRNKRTGRMQWHARYTFQGERTPFAPLPARIVEDDKAGAEACAQQRYQWLLEHGAVPDYVKETVAEYAKRWLKDRELRVTSIRDDRSRLTYHVLPTLGELDVHTFERDDVEKMRDELDAKIASGALSWKTAANCWTLATKMCGDMVSSKRRELRVRQDNPCREVRAPDRGAEKAKQYLYPSEFLQLVSCESVPIRWRRAVAIGVYTFLRDGELRVLRWNEGDVDLEHGVLSITRAWNRRSSGIKETKTGHPRRFSIEANLLELLKAMKKQSRGKGLVVALASERAMARNLRRWLWKAGVRRPELHEASPTRKQLTWHDLRATGLTWMAVRGDDPLKIQQRAGHTTFGTTQGYIREAEAVREGFGKPFPPLPSCLLDPFGRFSDSSLIRSTKPLKNKGRGRGGRDSNAQGVNRETAEIHAATLPDHERCDPEKTRSDLDSRPLAVVSRPLATENPEVGDQEIERAIVDAVRLGLGDVARALVSMLDRRRRDPNVIDLESRRRGSKEH